MAWTSMLAIYALFWAFSVFLVLPFGVRTTQEVGGAHVPGTAESAPHEFRPRRIAIRVTLVATVLFVVFLLNFRFGWVTEQSLTFFNLQERAEVR